MNNFGNSPLGNMPMGCNMARQGTVVMKGIKIIHTEQRIQYEIDT